MLRNQKRKWIERDEKQEGKMEVSALSTSTCVALTTAASSKPQFLLALTLEGFCCLSPPFLCFVHPAPPFLCCSHSFYSSFFFFLLSCSPLHHLLFLWTLNGCRLDSSVQQVINQRSIFLCTRHWGARAGGCDTCFSLPPAETHSHRCTNAVSSAVCLLKIVLSTGIISFQKVQFWKKLRAFTKRFTQTADYFL